MVVSLKEALLHGGLRLENPPLMKGGLIGEKHISIWEGGLIRPWCQGYSGRNTADHVSMFLFPCRSVLPLLEADLWISVVAVFPNGIDGRQLDDGPSVRKAWCYLSA